MKLQHHIAHRAFLAGSFAPQGTTNPTSLTPPSFRHLAITTASGPATLGQLVMLADVAPSLVRRAQA